MSGNTAITVTTLMAGRFVGWTFQRASRFPSSRSGRTGSLGRRPNRSEHRESQVMPGWWLTTPDYPGDHTNVQKPGTMHVQTPISKPSMQKPGPKPSPR